jgi:hypothetical protein
MTDLGAKRTKEVSAYETVASAKRAKRPPLVAWRVSIKRKSERQGNVALVPVRAASWIKDTP